MLVDAYEDCCVIEDRGLKKLLPLLSLKDFKGRFVLVSRNSNGCSQLIQKTCGDLIVNLESGESIVVEIKTEQENRYKNFFLETWSNRKRFTRGWMFHCESDVLWYFFQDTEELFSIHLPTLKRWAFIDGNIYRYPEKEQQTREQKNDTWGRCVPIKDIEIALKPNFRKIICPEKVTDKKTLQMLLSF